MKKSLLIATQIVLLCTVTLTAKADDAANAGHPCKQVLAACEAAGYYNGGSAIHKGLWVNCMTPLMAWKTVKDVAIDPRTLTACAGPKAEKNKKSSVDEAAQRNILNLIKENKAVHPIEPNNVPTANPPNSSPEKQFNPLDSSDSSGDVAQ